MVWIWSIVFDSPMIQIFALYLDLDMVTGFLYTHIPNLALYLDFEGAKNIHVLEVLCLGYGGCWRFLTGVYYLDHDS